MNEAEALDIRVKLQGAREAITEVERLTRSTTGMGKGVEGAGKKAKGAAGGFQLFRKRSDEANRSASFGVGIMRKAAGAALRLGLAYAGLHQAKEAISNTIQLAKVTSQLSRNFGLTTQQASELGAVIHVRGIDLRQLQMGFTLLSRNMQGAIGGSKNAMSAFDQLGITTQDLTNGQHDFYNFLLLVGDRLGKLPGGAQRAAVAQALLGRGAQKLLPLFKQGSETLREQIDLANKYGATLDGKPLKSMLDLIHVQHELEFAQLGFQVQFATRIAPALVKWFNLILKVIDAYHKLSPAAKDAVKIAAGALLGFSIGGPWGALVGGLVVAAILIKNNWGKIKPIFNEIKAVLIDTFWNTVHTVFAFLLKITHTTGSDWVAFGHGIVNYAKFIWTYIKILGAVWLWIAAKVWWPLMRTYIPGVIGALEGFAQIVGGVVKLVGGILTGDWHRAWEGFKQIMSGALKVALNLMRAFTAPFRKIARIAFGAITGAFKWAFNKVIDIWDSLHFKIGGWKVGPVRVPHVSVGLPTIPHLAMGGVATAGGSALVGDAGPEILSIPKGAMIRPLTRTEKAAPIDVTNSGEPGRPIVVISRVFLNKKQIAEAVSEHVSDRQARS